MGMSKGGVVVGGGGRLRRLGWRYIPLPYMDAIFL